MAAGLPALARAGAVLLLLLPLAVSVCVPAPVVLAAVGINIQARVHHISYISALHMIACKLACWILIVQAYFDAE